MLKFIVDDVVIVIVVRHMFYVVVVICYAFKKERKSKNDFECFLFFNYIVIDKKKKSKNNFCWFFFRSNFVIVFVNVIIIVSKFLFASQSISLWFSSKLKNMIMIFEVFLKNENCFIIHFDESLLTELIHNVSSLFMLSFDSIFFVMFAFVSFFFVLIIFTSSFNAFRFRKRVHESSSSTLKKKNRLTNDHCDYTLSSK